MSKRRKQAAIAWALLLCLPLCACKRSEESDLLEASKQLFGGVEETEPPAGLPDVSQEASGTLLEPSEGLPEETQEPVASSPAPTGETTAQTGETVGPAGGAPLSSEVTLDPAGAQPGPSEAAGGQGPETAASTEGTPIDVAGLRAVLEKELATCTGQWALYWKCLDTGDEIVLDGGEPMVAASLIKLFVAGAYFEAVEQGRLEAAPELLGPMIRESDNGACNQLIDRLGDGDPAAGMEAVNAFADSIGCSSSRLARKMLDPAPPENYTSVSDCGKLLERVYNGTFVSKAASEEMMDCLLEQTRTWKIPAGVPQGVKTANKTGELATVENDAAIVWASPHPYILCVMSDDILSPAAGQSNIAGLSKLAYDYLAASQEAAPS